jgi:hypothetical protein
MRKTVKCETLSGQLQFQPGPAEIVAQNFSAPCQCIAFHFATDDHWKHIWISLSDGCETPVR